MSTLRTVNIDGSRFGLVQIRASSLVSVGRIPETKLKRDQTPARDHPFMSSIIEHLQANGYVAVLFDYDASVFIRELDSGSRLWFNDKMVETIGDKWTTLAPHFDLFTTEGRDRVFLHRKVHADPSTCAAMRFVLQGDSNMGLAHMYRSWSKKGFGKWAYITPGAGLSIALKARDTFTSMNIPAIIDGIPHVINKPPGGDALDPHTDAMPIKDLIHTLRSHLDSEDPSTYAWVKEHGMQCLAHMEGGIEDGYTYAIGPMNPGILWICLTAVRDGRIRNALPKNTTIEKWLNGDNGPTFMNWKTCLPQFNALLEEKSLPPVKVCPITPDTNESFMACWPKHFPHGSAKNRKRRVSLTLPLKINGLPLTEESRCDKRMRHLSNIAHGSPEDREIGEAWIAQDKKPYYGGKTHKNPNLSAQWFRPGAPYHAIAPRPEEVDRFVEGLSQ